MTASPPWGPNCCCDCPCFEDTFFRADSTDLGDDWEETVGDSEISGNQLLIPQGGIVRCLQRPQGTKYSFFNEVALLEPAEGVVRRMLVNFKDINNYWFWEIGEDYLGIQQVKAGELIGVMSRLDGLVLYPLTVRSCFNPQQFWVGLKANTAQIWIGNPEIIEDGYYAGLMNNSGSNLDAYYESFLFCESFATNRKCPACGCWCENNTLNTLLALHIAARGDPEHGGSFGTAAGWWDGKTGGLNADASEPGTVWKGDLAYNGPSCPTTPSQSLHYNLRCHGIAAPNNPQPSDFRFTVNFIEYTPNENSTCDPFYLEIDPINLGPCSGSGMPPNPDNIIVFSITE